MFRIVFGQTSMIPFRSKRSVLSEPPRWSFLHGRSSHRTPLPPPPLGPCSALALWRWSRRRFQARTNPPPPVDVGTFSYVFVPPFCFIAATQSNGRVCVILIANYRLELRASPQGASLKQGKPPNQSIN